MGCYLLVVSKFEDALLHFHTTLSDAVHHYKNLFLRMVAGDDISRLLNDDIYCHAVQRLRYQLHEEQHRLSRHLGNMDGVYSVGELNTLIPDKFHLNIVEISNGCIKCYSELRLHIDAISRYFESKVTEYRDFFERIYNDPESTRTYNDEGKMKSHDNGLLVSASA